MGDKEWTCDFPEGEGICPMQGDTISATHNSDTQLRQGVGTHCLRKH